jgi:hypothetical protein
MKQMLNELLEDKLESMAALSPQRPTKRDYMFGRKGRSYEAMLRHP